MAGIIDFSLFTLHFPLKISTFASKLATYEFRDRGEMRLHRAERDEASLGHAD
jgi:hypothetical protein